MRLPGQGGENHYRLASEVRRRRLYRIGYAAQGRHLIRREVRLGWRAAEREHIELMCGQPVPAQDRLRSADYLVRNRWTW